MISSLTIFPSLTIAPSLAVVPSSRMKPKSDQFWSRSPMPSEVVVVDFVGKGKIGVYSDENVEEVKQIVDQEV